MNHLSIKYELCTGEHGVACVKSEVKYYSLTNFKNRKLFHNQQSKS